MLSSYKVLCTTYAYILAKYSQGLLACFVNKQCNQLYNATKLGKGKRLGDVPTESNTQPAHIQTILPEARGILHQLEDAHSVLAIQVTSSKRQLESQDFVLTKARMVHAVS